MSLIGNLVFFVFGGFAIFLGYVLGGILLCLTIIGIPFGLMCFRLAGEETVDQVPAMTMKFGTPNHLVRS